MMTKETARHIAARVWCDEEFSSYIMDVDAVEEIADIILFVANKQDRNDSSGRSGQPIIGSFLR